MSRATRKQRARVRRRRKATPTAIRTAEAKASIKSALAPGAAR